MANLVVKSINDNECSLSQDVKINRSFHFSTLASHISNLPDVSWEGCNQQQEGYMMFFLQCPILKHLSSL